MGPEIFAEMTGPTVLESQYWPDLRLVPGQFGTRRQENPQDRTVDDREEYRHTITFTSRYKSPQQTKLIIPAVFIYHSNHQPPNCRT